MAATPEQHIDELENRLQVCENELQQCREALHNEEVKRIDLQTNNENLDSVIKEIETEYLKLEKKTKDCEKAIEKAQQETKIAQAHRDRLGNSQNELQICQEALHNEEIKRNDLQADNENLKSAIQRIETEYLRLEKHNRNCEKATERAQKETKTAKANADHLINSQKDSQKGQLKNAEWKYESVARDLRKWTDKYGSSVDKPANDNHALQLKVSEWQSKAERARNENALLEAQIQGTPEQVGLHQALEEWEEHQGCSEEFAGLQDRLHDETLRRQERETDLATSKQRHQKTRSDLKASQIKAVHFEQAFNSIKGQDKTSEYLQRIRQLESDLQASTGRHQNLEEHKTALQEKVYQLEKASETSRDQERTDINMSDDAQPEKQKLESDLKAFQERYYKKDLDVKALEEDIHRLEQANQVLKDQINSHINMLQKLESDQKASREQLQETDSSKKALQEKAKQLEFDRNMAEEQVRIAKSEKEVLQEKARRLEQDLETTKKQYQTAESDKRVHQEKITQLGLDLETTKEQHKITVSNMEALQEKAHQLEQANKSLQEKGYERLQAEATEKREQDDQEDGDVANAMQRDRERMELVDHESDSGNADQGKKNQRSRIHTSRTAKRSQVTPPLSPMYTSSEGSQDWERTPRPKISLRQDLGYSSQDPSDEEQSHERRSDEEQSVVNMPQQGGAMMSRRTETDEEKGVGADTWMSEEDDEEEHSDESARQRERILISMDRRATFPSSIYPQDHYRRPKSLDPLELRARDRVKEQSEILETLFECTPAKASTIDRRLKALGPGCRLLEAPALVAYELSGIREDVYKGLASGLLIASTPLNEVNDMGTDPVNFSNDVSTDTDSLLAEAVTGPLPIVNDVATDTSDLATEDIAVPPFIANDVATDTAGLLVAEDSILKKIMSRFWNSIPEIWMSLTIFFGLTCLYVWLKPDTRANHQHQIMYTGYANRHIPFRTPLKNTSTEVIVEFPPLPAPQLGLLRMMSNSSFVGGLTGSNR